MSAAIAIDVLRRELGRESVALRRAVRHEVRIAALLDRPTASLPPPNDLDSEQEITAAVLAGYFDPRASELRGEHFYSRLFGFVYVAAEAVLSAGYEVELSHVRAALIAQDFCGPEIERELVQIRDATPYVTPAILAENAARIIDLWRARKLIETMARVDAGLRCGAITYAAAVEQLEGVCCG